VQHGLDLNNYIIADHDGCHQPLQDYGTEGMLAGVRVHFRNLEEHLCTYIAASPFVVGAVAWLTSERILAALRKCEAVALVVQKEDFLRPDECVDRSGWAATLRQRYEALPDFSARFCVPHLGKYWWGGDCSLAAVRCVGNYNHDRRPAHPRMHHKFLVFCRRATAEELGDEPDGDVVPMAVWTGSFNMTQTAARSLENALYITDPVIVLAYYNEWVQIMGLSEPLDWDTEWCAPEWRTGS
jgi:hypothetical protein